MSNQVNGSGVVLWLERWYDQASDQVVSGGVPGPSRDLIITGDDVVFNPYMGSLRHTFLR